MLSIDERRRGALIGAAVGDALGVTYEFMAPHEIPPQRFEMVGGGPFDFPAGAGSDDTDLLQAALGAYRARGEFDSKLMVANMLAWLDGGPPDIGNQTRSALLSWRDGEQPRDDRHAQGNGGLMRAAAHALACDDAASAARFAALDTRLTHPSDTAADCSAFYAATLWWMIADEDIEAAMKLAAEDRRSFRPYRKATGSPGGHCVHSLRLALWAAREADSFEAAIDAVIRTGGDTDTNATIAGALLGAKFGQDGIPRDWRAGLADADPDAIFEEIAA